MGKEAGSANDTFSVKPESEVLNRQIRNHVSTVSYATLLRYATRNDWYFMCLGTLAAIIAGAMEPLSVLVFGNLSNTFGSFLKHEVSQDYFTSELTRYSLYFVYIAIGQFVFSYIATTTFIYTGDHIAAQFRVKFLSSVLRQNIGFLDTIGAGEVTTGITTDTNLIQEGISEKVGVSLIACSSFVAAFVISFIIYWRLTLILSSTIFAFLFTLSGLSRFMVKYHVGALSRYAEGVVHQYDGHLTRVEAWGYNAKASMGLFNAFIICYVYLTYSLAFWQGSRYLVQGILSFSNVLIVVMSIMLGAFAICNSRGYREKREASKDRD